MRGNSLLMTQGCFWANHPDVLPYFIRSTLIQHQTYIKELTPALKACITVPIEEFANMANSRQLPNEFYSTEAAMLSPLDCIQRIDVFMGMFYSLQLLESAQINFSWVDVDYEKCTSVFKRKTLYTIPLLKQPTPPFTSKACFPYKNADEVSMEINSITQAMGVEFPKRFPFQAYIGVLKGLITIPKAVVE